MHSSYRVADTPFAVRSTSPEYGAWVDRTLAAYAIPTSERPEYSVVVDGGGGPTRSAQGRRFHVLYRGAGPLVRTFDLGTVARALFAELEGKQLGSRTDGAFVHAALVRWEDVDTTACG